MAVAHDTATRSSTTFDNNSVSFSHAGAAGTRGVAVLIAVEAGGTHLFGNDFGADSAMWSRKAVAAGATSMGYTAASDVFAHIALAIAEVAATVLPQRPLLMINSAVARAATR